MSSQAEFLSSELAHMKYKFEICLNKKVEFDEEMEKMKDRVKSSFEEYERVQNSALACLAATGPWDIVSDPFIAHMMYITARVKYNAKLATTPELIGYCYDVIHEIECARLKLTHEALENTMRDQGDVCKRMLEALESERKKVVVEDTWRDFVFQKEIPKPYQETEKTKNWENAPGSELRPRTLASFPSPSFFPELLHPPSSFFTLPNNANGLFIVKKKFQFPKIVGEVKGGQEEKKEVAEGGLKYRCEMVELVARVFLEGVFSWSERFLLVSSFGILHLFEHDYSRDLFNLSGEDQLKIDEQKREEGGEEKEEKEEEKKEDEKEEEKKEEKEEGEKKEEKEEKPCPYQKKVPKITQAKIVESIPLGNSYLKSVDPPARIFVIVHRSKKIFERNKQYRFQCKTEQHVVELLRYLKPYMGESS